MEIREGRNNIELPENLFDEEEREPQVSVGLHNKKITF